MGGYYLITVISAHYIDKKIFMYLLNQFLSSFFLVPAFQGFLQTLISPGVLKESTQAYFTVVVYFMFELLLLSSLKLSEFVSIHTHTVIHIFHYI